MKKLLLLNTSLAIIVAATTSFNVAAPPPRIFPELDAFFKSIDAKQFNKDRLQSLVNIKYQISASNIDTEDWNIIFYCSENAFRSQASEVFAETLCYARKHKKVKFYSAGLTSGEINSKFIDYLSKIGYQIAKSEKNGKTRYEVKFSDKADPIILYSKTVTDSSLPTKDITSVIVCDTSKEADCATLKTAGTAFHLPFEEINSTDDEQKAAAVLKSIAAEMLYVTNK